MSSVALTADYVRAVDAVLIAAAIVHVPLWPTAGAAAAAVAVTKDAGIFAKLSLCFVGQLLATYPPLVLFDVDQYLEYLK